MFDSGADSKNSNKRDNLKKGIWGSIMCLLWQCRDYSRSMPKWGKGQGQVG